MDPRSFLSPTEVTEIGVARRQGYATARAFWRDLYEIRRTARDAGWDTGDPEALVVVEAGVGKLAETGPGAESSDEVTIIGLAPYRFRLDAATVLTDNDTLVVNGRTFLVQGVTRGDIDDEVADAALQERSTGGPG